PLPPGAFRLRCRAPRGQDRVRRVRTISKEERLFLELAKRRGAVTAAAGAAAVAKAQEKGVSVVEALTEAGLSRVATDALSKELFKLSFTCERCEGFDFHELDEPRSSAAVCFECRG